MQVDLHVTDIHVMIGSISVLHNEAECMDLYGNS